MDFLNILKKARVLPTLNLPAKILGRGVRSCWSQFWIRCSLGLSETPASASPLRILPKIMLAYKNGISKMGHFFFQKSKEHNKAQNCGFKKAIWKMEEGPRAFIKAMPDLVKNKNEIFEVAETRFSTKYAFLLNDSIKCWLWCSNDLVGLQDIDCSCLICILRSTLRQMQF